MDGFPLAQVAQLVEHVTENHGVGGSIPPLGTIFPLNINELYGNYVLPNVGAVFLGSK